MEDPLAREIWLLKATPTDPAQRPFLLGEGTLVCFSHAEAKELATRALRDLVPQGIASIEPVCVKI